MRDYSRALGPIKPLGFLGPMACSTPEQFLAHNGDVMRAPELSLYVLVF